MSTSQTVLRSAALLALFAFLGTALVAATYQGTRDQIRENERLALLNSLRQLVPESDYDNNLLEERITLPAHPLLGSDEERFAYLAKLHGQVHTVLLEVSSREGYTGTINLLVAIHKSGEVAGVRTLSHAETPGLGDLIEIKKSEWILGFNGHSLDNLTRQQWQVKRDGGTFDQFTGATITPRAVVKAVYRALRYFNQQRDKLLLKPTPSNKPPSKQHPEENREKRDEQ
ncbi:MAG: electron transport complex subunit RsxG [Gammaproteobacteria bacterium]|nr:electron transport complex subunit RsxG [Gammaproteobacteria bacterium]